MGSMIQSILDYIVRTALLTVEQLAIVLGPVLILAFILDHLSQFVRKRAARIVGLKPYIYLTAPGVMVHELGHAFFCVIFRHRIISMHLFKPGRDGTLGSVEHAFNPRSVYQRIGNFFIGTGPIWFGSALVCLLVWYLLGPAASDALRDVAAPRGGTDIIATTAGQAAGAVWQLFTSLLRPSVVSSWQFWVFAYFIFCSGSHITLSRSDIHGAFSGFVSLVALVFVFNLLTVSFGEEFSVRACRELLRGSVVFCAGISLVACLNLVLALILLVVSLAVQIVR
jgi:hypothetical protein